MKGISFQIAPWPMGWRQCEKLPKNVGDLGKLIVAKGSKKSPKVQ